MDMTELCSDLKNWFDKDEHGYYGVLSGTFTIEDGNIDLSEFLLDGQYFRIENSVFNDRVYEYGKGGMRDETFTGKIYAMKVKPEVVDLLAEINKWLDKYGEIVYSPYSSESFTDYSYNKPSASGGDFATTQVGGWQSVFLGKLNKWRKI